MEIITVRGRNNNVDTSFEPITLQGVYQTPTTVKQVYLDSTSAADSATGSGAREVRIVGLDGNFIEQEELVVPDGINQVNLLKSWTRIFGMTVEKSGTYGTFSQGSHAGNLEITTQGSSVRWGRILAGTGYPRGRSEIGCYTIPAGKIGRLINFYAKIDDGAVMDLLVVQRSNADNVEAPFSPVQEYLGLEKVTGSVRFKPLTPLEIIEGPCDVMCLGRVPTTQAGVSVVYELKIENA